MSNGWPIDSQTIVRKNDNGNCLFSILIFKISYPIHKNPFFLQFVFCLALLFIYTSFTANIVALLQSTTKSIRTLTDLLNSNIELGVADTPYARYLFPNEDEPVRRKIYEQKIAPPNEPPHFMNVSHGVDRVRKGLFGFHSEKGPLYREIKNTFYEHEKCGLVEITHLRVIDPWYGIPKHSPYKEIFKVK